MYFIDAKRLIQTAAEHDILYTEDNYVAVYRKSGTPPEEYPEGWYLEPVDEVARDLMDDAEGQRCLITALAKKDITFEEIEPAMCADADKLLAFTGDSVHFEERRPGEFWATPNEQ